MADNQDQDNTLLRIATWNINGIRAWCSGTDDMKGALDFLDADVICLQETKIPRSALRQNLAIVDGYNSYFGFSRDKAGHAGVATFCRDDFTPCRAEEGLSGLLPSAQVEDSVGCYGDMESKFSRRDMRRLDNEGRTVVTQHIVLIDSTEVNLNIINVYCPRAEPGNEEKIRKKLIFYEMLESRVQALVNAGHLVIVVGDINTAHKPIDVPEVSDMEEFNNDPCRKWLNHFIYDHCAEATGNVDTGTVQLLDSFRILNPHETCAFTCWCTRSNARSTNYGTRIDYILIDSRIGSKLVDCDIKRLVVGSDHCPVKAVLSLKVMKAPKVPSLSTKYFPEFTGKQSRLSNYFRSVSAEEKTSASTESDSHTTLSKAMEVEPVSSTMPQNKDKQLANLSKCTEGSSLGNSNTQKKSLKRSWGKPNTQKSQKSSLGKPSSQKSQRRISSFFTKSLSSQTQTTTETAESVSSVSENASQYFCDVNNLSSSGTPASNTDLNYDVTQISETPSLPSLSQNMQRESSHNLWQKMFTGPKEPPKCEKHGVTCVQKVVKKKGNNMNRLFWVCAKGNGRSDDPNASCGFFMWDSDLK
ncbi:DNA-(apurinic or apyrimidinic site) endonuclease 2-like [Periplaneta americana]|uniref:DNA-(apurinic or apyrimidinic site) endonuclease 2-like n=1 Tax=Periplaneta americana TaxID=6978 RepID=UPI0037E8CFC5